MLFSILVKPYFYKTMILCFFFLKRPNWMLPDELGTTCPTRAAQYVPFFEALPRLEQFAGFVIFRQITLLEMLWMPMDGLYFQDQHLIVWGSYMNNLGKYLLTLMTLCIRTQKWEEWMQLQQQAEIGLLTFVNFCLHSLTINKQTIIDRAATVPCKYGLC